jgi:hypothetical protein
MVAAVIICRVHLVRHVDDVAPCVEASTHHNNNNNNHSVALVESPRSITEQRLSLAITATATQWHCCWWWWWWRWHGDCACFATWSCASTKPAAVSPRTRTKLRARFDAMPDSVLLRIFSYLSIEDVVLRVSLLNYRCYQLSQNSAVFESVDLSRQTLSDEAFVDLLCELGWSTLRSLAPPSALTSRGLHALSTCRSLGVLQLRNNPKISSHLLQRVVEYAEWQLHTIDLTGIIATDEVVLALADRFDHCLESLSLVQMTPLAITDRSVAHLMRQCHALRHVSLRSCRSVTPLAFEEISSERLASVDVADCVELDDRFVKRLVKIAPRLRSLVLSGLARITDKPLIELLRAPRRRCATWRSPSARS